ncbi:hypothetical protein [Jonesia quinghaiensis]|uniref:hypothetical protein n=1 Tax=Jonesia quinghaiensis TaxID=262806 RepID=UPI0004007B5E|nr:hypothetical protein [Jonesia quinghaiensis]
MPKERTMQKLFERWIAAAPQAPQLAEVGELLREHYNAYQIPTDFMEPDGLENDEEVRVDLVAALYTITNPLTLGQFSRGAAKRLSKAARVEAAEEAEEYWQELFDGPSEELPYRLISAQHALGQRVSILLECEGAAVTGFKVYGVHGEEISNYLLALIGFPQRRPTDPVDGPFMRPGDLTDELFCEYLAAATAHGRI